MAINNFIPTVWSETLLRSLDREYIGVRNCNREFEGDIKDKGSSVKIGAIGDINIFDYTKNTDMNAPETLSDSMTTLYIDQAKAFNFQIDDIDRAQSQPKLMEAAMKQAASALANVADKYIYSLHSEAEESNHMVIDNVNAEEILDCVLVGRRALLSNGVNSNLETSLEVSPEVATMLLRSKMINATDNVQSLENGHIGKLLGFDVYVSPNVVTEGTRHLCFCRTKRAIAFAEQLNEVEAYRPESRFADALKGLHLYGAKVVYPKEFVVLDLSIT